MRDPHVNVTSEGLDMTLQNDVEKKLAIIEPANNEPMIIDEPHEINASKKILEPVAINEPMILEPENEGPKFNEPMIISPEKIATPEPTMGKQGPSFLNTPASEFLDRVVIFNFQGV